jgi:glutaredoxin
MADLVLVTSPGCHLCGHAREALAALGLDAREIDLGSAEARALAARGVPLAFLPVLWDGDRVIAYGRLSQRRLAKDLAA